MANMQAVVSLSSILIKAQVLNWLHVYHQFTFLYGCLSLKEWHDTTTPFHWPIIITIEGISS